MYLLLNTSSNHVKSLLLSSRFCRKFLLASLSHPSPSPSPSLSTLQSRSLLAIEARKPFKSEAITFTPNTKPKTILFPLTQSVSLFSTFSSFSIRANKDEAIEPEAFVTIGESERRRVRLGAPAGRNARAKEVRQLRGGTHGTGREGLGFSRLLPTPRHCTSASYLRYAFYFLPFLILG